MEFHMFLKGVLQKRKSVKLTDFLIQKDVILTQMKIQMMEAAGIEPASKSCDLGNLHAYSICLNLAIGK